MVNLIGNDVEAVTTGEGHTGTSFRSGGRAASLRKADRCVREERWDM